MNGIINIFQKLLERFRFGDPISEADQQYMLKNKFSAFRSVLKKVGQYSLVYGATLRIYFSAQRAGVKLTLAQSKLVLALLVILLSGGLAIAGIILPKYTDSTIIIPDKTCQKEYGAIPQKDKKNKKPEKSTKKAKNKDRQKETTVDDSPNYRFGVESFTGRVEKSTIHTATNGIYHHLRRLKGKRKVIIQKGKRKNINRLIIGNINKFGNSYIITTRVIDIQTSKVLYAVSDEAETEGEINKACARIANKIARKIE